jgi:hypothetical protein
MSAPLQKLREWRQSPLCFVKDCIQVTPSAQQIDLLNNFAKHKRTTIRSGHGTGKDAATAWLVLWFLVTRPYAKVVCTAPTARQLADILWSEISKWLRRSILADEFVIQKDKIFHKESKEEWWARAVSTSVKASAEDQAETLAGFHGDHLLIVVDEASGVPDPVYVPLEGALTQEDNRVLLIGNMTKNNGYFYDTHFHPSLSKDWFKLHWDSRKSTNVTESMIQYFINKYGVDSNVFRIRVAGDPPLESETTLIPLAWAIQCVGNEISVPEDEPLYLGVDVARYGEDTSVILPRRGNQISPWEEFHGLNTIALADRIIMTLSDLEAEGIAIDEIGVGAGVVDYIHRKPNMARYCYGINVAVQSSNKMRFHRLRDELWWEVREKCMRAEYSFPDIWIEGQGGLKINIGHELCNELSQPTYRFDENMAITVESKRDMKTRGVASPNIADALGLTEYFHTTAYKIWGTKQREAVEKAARKRANRRKEKAPMRRGAWQCA